MNINTTHLNDLSKETFEATLVLLDETIKTANNKLYEAQTSLVQSEEVTYRERLICSYQLQAVGRFDVKGKFIDPLERYGSPYQEWRFNNE